MEWLKEHGWDLLLALEHLVLAISFVTALTKTEKDDKVLSYIKNVIAKFLSFK